MIHQTKFMLRHPFRTSILFDKIFFAEIETMKTFIVNDYRIRYWCDFIKFETKYFIKISITYSPISV